jgi:hypothetical protein
LNKYAKAFLQTHIKEKDQEEAKSSDGTKQLHVEALSDFEKTLMPVA